MFKAVLNSHWFIWAILALPSIPMIGALVSGQPSPEGKPVAEMLLHPTGEFAARFIIIAMILTPMRMLFPASAFWRWMMKRRRYFGVAAFAYAAFHTALYLVDMGSLRAVLGEALALGIWTGWVAFFVFVPLAVTSNDWSLRRMGPTWKTLQRWAYLAAVCTLLHWIFVHNNIGPALVHFVPLAGLGAYRLWRNASPKKQTIEEKRDAKISDTRRTDDPAHLAYQRTCHRIIQLRANRPRAMADAGRTD